MLVKSNLTRLYQFGPANRARHTAVQLSLEILADRSLPSAYFWTGAGADRNWTTLTNWTLEDGAIPTAQPNFDDDVYLQLGAPAAKRNPIVNQEFTVQSMWIIDSAGYTLTLADDLLVTTRASLAGTIEEGFPGPAKLTLGGTDYSEFYWVGEIIDVDVRVLGDATFDLIGDLEKELREEIRLFPGSVSTWDGESTFSLSTSSAKVWVESGAGFTVTGDRDATISMVHQSNFRNDGTVTVAMDPGKTLTFDDPGFDVQNFGTMEVTSGNAATKNLQNVGTIRIVPANSTFTMGSQSGEDGDWTYLESGSVITGAGVALWRGNGVVMPGGLATVNNVKDACEQVTGTGVVVHGLG